MTNLIFTNVADAHAAAHAFVTNVARVEKLHNVVTTVTTLHAYRAFACCVEITTASDYASYRMTTDGRLPNEYEPMTRDDFRELADDADFDRDNLSRVEPLLDRG